jgi:hypothetical protein
MKAKRKTAKQPEPVGIVISQGWGEEKPSVFSAYVWGPAPEEGAGKGKRKGKGKPVAA